MAARFDLTLDCADPARLAAFWKLALGYEDEPPPAITRCWPIRRATSSAWPSRPAPE
jgi:hypothetical protein